MEKDNSGRPVLVIQRMRTCHHAFWNLEGWIKDKQNASEEAAKPNLVCGSP